MNDKKREVMHLLKDALQRSSERSSTEGYSATMTSAEARKKVAQTFDNQLLERKGAKDPGVQAYIGMLALQDVFTSIPTPPSEEEIQGSIERSQKDYQVFQALRILARLKLAPQSEALNGWEQNLLLGLVNEPPLPKGPPPYRDAHRNMLIVSQVRRLEELGFKPTRNDARSVNSLEVESGCDIVAEALVSIGENISYQGVVGVWKDRNRQPQPRFLADLMASAILKSD